MDCLFCTLANKSDNKIYENDKIYVINDINPQAKHHLLIIPKTHISDSYNIENFDIISDIFKVAKVIADKLNIKSYRVVTNYGKDAGQTVFHLHFHLISGENLGNMC